MPDNIITLEFSDNKLPEFKKFPGKDHVYFGEDDKYPEWLLYLFDKSPKHGAIVGGKIDYITGGGLKAPDELAAAWAKQVNDYEESLSDLAEKLCTDIEIFGGCYAQIIYNAAGDLAGIYHLEFHKVRISRDGDKYYYKNDWSDRKEERKEFDVYDPKKKQKSAVFFYSEYRPGVKEYALPGYLQIINYVDADVEVSKHTLTNSKAGFSASKFINFYNGEPTEEGKREMERRFEVKYTGAEGKKLILGFNNDPAKRPTVDDLGASDLTKEDFAHVDNLISSNIYAGHKITSPMLFGIKTEGQLGGTTELRNAYDIFKNTYVAKKQKNLAKVLNLFAKLKGVTPSFTFIPVDPIGFEFTENAMLEAAPKSWLMEKMGIDTAKYTDATVKAPTIAPNATTAPSTAPTPQQAANAVPEQQMVNENIKNLTGRQHQQMLRIVKQFTQGKLTEQQARLLLKTSLGLSDADVDILLGINDPAQEDEFAAFYDESQVAEMFSEVGEGREAFEVIQSKKVVFNSDREAIEDELGVYQTFDLEEAAKDATIGKKVKDITKVIKKLPQIYIKYTYEVIPGEGPAIIPTTRPFCRRMVELSATRLWSRTDIEKISERLGYSVWDRRGGFWNNGGKVEKHCRHYWMRHIVIKKNNG